MSVLVIWSSPNKDGLTATVAGRVVEGIKESEEKMEVIHLNKKRLKNCLACNDGWGMCRTEGQCVIKDDFQFVYDKIIWITAVYWHDITEQLKCLMDRLRRCETAHN